MTLSTDDEDAGFDADAFERDFSKAQAPPAPLPPPAPAPTTCQLSAQDRHTVEKVLRGMLRLLKGQVKSPPDFRPLNLYTK